MPSLHDLFVTRDIALRLPLRFDAARLSGDLAEMDESWWSLHKGPYHDGRWEMISLRAPGGDMLNQTSRGGAFADTIAGRRCRYLQEVLSQFPAELNRVRYMRLRAGGHVMPHSDPMHTIDPSLVRIHVPVVTNPAVVFRVAGERIVMGEGEAWYVDVRFRHEVRNEGASDRIHLVIDLLRNDAVDEMLRNGDSSGRRRLTGYLLKHTLPGRVKRWAGIGN
jgi:hypothetical protein